MSKELAKLHHEDERLTNQISHLLELRAEVRNRIAEMECPFKVGDNIISAAGEMGQVIKIMYGYGPYEFWYKRRNKHGDLLNLARKAYPQHGWRKDDEG
jgi:hypothetical protein